MVGVSEGGCQRRTRRVGSDVGIDAGSSVSGNARAPLWNELAIGFNRRQMGIAADASLVEGPRPQRLPDPPGPMAEVDRVMNPPSAVVAPQMVGVVGSVDPKRWESD